jgi:hypothetical protein
MTYMICYQPHPADLRRGPDVAHAVSNIDPNRSVAGELLYGDISREEWPGRGLACDTCSEALGASAQSVPAGRPYPATRSQPRRRPAEESGAEFLAELAKGRTWAAWGTAVMVLLTIALIALTVV